MQTRILNLPQALKLSTILGKYITSSPDPEAPISDFFDSILEKFSPNDFKECIELLTDSPVKDELDGTVLLTALFEGMQKNKIFTLLKSAKEIGFV